MKRVLLFFSLALLSGSLFAQTSTAVQSSCIDAAGNLNIVYDISDPALICSGESSLMGKGSIGFHSGTDNFSGSIIGYDAANAKAGTEIAPGVFQLSLNVYDYYGISVLPSNIAFVFNGGVGDSNPWDTVGRDTVPGGFGCADLMIDLSDISSCVCDASMPVTGLSAEVSGGSVTLSWCPVPASAGCRIKSTFPNGQVKRQDVIGTGVRSFTASLSGRPEGTYEWQVRCSCDLASGTPNSEISTFVNVAPPRLGETSAMDVFPNPATENITISLNAEANAETQLMIMDINGKLIDMTNVSLVTGANTITLDVSFLETGLYMIQTANGNAVERFAVSR